ncbi:MAG TPA: hypothetical protein PLZ16_09520 [Gammaproteobacteria bacterium]|nr:hypothetical protein [Gammaproteobacteria bacterium]
MKLLLIFALLTMTGCGTVDSIKNSDKTDFVLVSHSQAGGAYKLIRGQTAACKLSMHGITGLNYQITVKDGECVVEAVK